MNKMPFSEDEFNFIAEMPGFFDAPSRKIWNAPVSQQENLKNAFFHPEKLCYVPNIFDATQFTPRCSPENTCQ